MGSCQNKGNTKDPKAKQVQKEKIQKRSNSIQQENLIEQKNIKDKQQEFNQVVQSQQYPSSELERVLQKSPSKRIEQRQFSFQQNDIQSFRQHPDSLVGQVDERTLQKSPTKKIPLSFGFEEVKQQIEGVSQDIINPTTQQIETEGNSSQSKEQERGQFVFELKKINHDQNQQINQQFIYQLTSNYYKSSPHSKYHLIIMPHLNLNLSHIPKYQQPT